MQLNLIRQLLQTSDASGSKSTILKPLTWLLSILIGGICALLYAKAPDWILILLSVTFALTIILLFGAYVYCLINDKDALRSETYSIQKMAIERGVIGDSSTGYIQVNNKQTSGKKSLLIEPQEEAKEDDNE